MSTRVPGALDRSSRCWPCSPASTPVAGQSSPASAAPAPQTAVELTLAHSYTDAQPQHACGAQVIADGAAAADVGLAVEIFGASQLGGDADRIASVASGDIDMDIQGASALSALYPPMAVVDGAFVFDDAEHLKRFFTDEASTPLKDGFLAATGVRILGAWSAGARQFTANKPIRTPGGPRQGLRMRFPPSPQFLMNAAAMGAERGRGRLRGALPRPPAGHRRRAGEPHQQHRGQQHPRGPGRTSACPATS